MDEVKGFLDEKVNEYNVPGFIAHDPVSVPHAFTKLQDIEIAGFFAATLAWGRRKTIIDKSRELMALMGNDPHAFVLHHTENDLKGLQHFKHRTFQPDDVLYFISFLSDHYARHNSLEEAFLRGQGFDMTDRLSAFNDYFFSLDYAPQRTRKHVPHPQKKSTCKRLNMFLRWMVRQDSCGVDFGLWKRISPGELVCPLDVHVDRVARRLGLLNRKQTDWKAALELTETLRLFDPEDPVKYDFALFGMGVEASKQ